MDIIKVRTMNTRAYTLGLGALIFLCASGGRATAAEPDAPKTEPGKAFVYKQSAGADQKVEVYYPPNWKPSNPKVPGVLLFHGGGWVGGDLSQFRPFCAYLASRGLVAATANYRMLPKGADVKAPNGELTRKRVCVTDAKSAIRWMKQHADELGVDPQRLVVGGGSAGGHISVLATTSPGLNDPADPTGFDTSVAAYLLFNPAFTARDSSDPEVDVLKHLTAAFPPAILFFGTKDSWRTGSDTALARLKALGNRKAELWIAENQIHGFYREQPWRDLTLAAADRFLVAQGLLTGPCSLPTPAEGVKLVRMP
jgi:acetyl esterase/lipase